MKTNKIVNFVILALVVTAVYQTGKLWLGGTASHNFFYTILSTIQQQNPQNQREDGFLLPTKYAIGNGNKKFAVFYPQPEKNQALLEQTNDFFYDMLEQGTSVEGKTNFHWDKFLAQPCLVFQYDFFVPIEEYREAVSSIQGFNMNYFDFLVMVPEKKFGETSTVYFINSSEGNYIQLSLENNQYASELFRKLSELEQDSHLTYVSTGQSGFKLFQSNVFVPQWADATYPYAPITMKDPVLQENTMSLEVVGNAVEGFFQNFASDWNTKKEEQTYVFSDEDVIVKYHKNGMLEYYSYANYQDQATGSLVSGYQVCRNFMKKDKTLENSVVLTDIKVDSEETIYYFDYVIHGFPIVLSKELKQTIGANHAIEIAVRNHAVRKYRRFARNFVLEPSATGLVDEDFLTALNQGILDYQQQEETKVVTEVEDIYLGYLVEQTSPSYLHWFTQLYGKTYIGHAEQPETKPAQPTDQ